MEDNREEIREEPFHVELEGITLRGFWFLRRGLARAPVLCILHGIPRAKPAPGDQSYRDMARHFAGLGFLAVIFNFRGAGLSDGDLSMAGWTRDLTAVLGFCRRLPAAGPRLALLGFSAGAAVAIYAAAQDPEVGAVVAASAPADFSKLETTLPASHWVTLFRKIGLIRSPAFPSSLEAWSAEFDLVSPLKWVDRISPRPLLLVHGEDDEVIPVASARELFAAALQPKQLLLVRGGKHRLRMDPAALELIESWLIKWKENQFVD